jgi:hypothetical protein
VLTPVTALRDDRVQGFAPFLPASPAASCAFPAKTAKKIPIQTLLFRHRSGVK